MAGFDRSKFIKANESAGGKGDFFTPEPGFYFVELTAAYTGNSKASDKFQACFTWKIAEDDEKAPNKTFSKYISLEGEHEEMGYQQLAQLVTNLHYQGDAETFASNPDAALETLVGTKVRMQVKANPKNKDFPYYNINKVIYSPVHDGVESVNSAPEDTDLVTPEPESNEDTVESGDLINITGHGISLVKIVDDNTNQVVAEVLKSKETVVAGVDKIEGMICKKEGVAAYLAKTAPKAVDKTPEAKPLPKPIEKVEEVVELPEVIEATKFEVGMMVEGKYKQDKIVGKIHALDGEIVKILMNRSVYPCKIETVKLVS